METGGEGRSGTAYVQMSPRETQECLLTVLNICNNFIGPLIGILRTARSALRSAIRVMERANLGLSSIEEAAQGLDHSVWQLEMLDQAMQKYYSNEMPPCETTDGTEPIARMIREINVISYNMRPAVRSFASPVSFEGVRSWEALRQPTDYLAFVKAGEDGDWLCRVMCSESAVRLVGASTGQPVNIRERTRLRWLGKNIEVMLRTGVKSYAVVFVMDEGQHMPKPSKREFAALYDALLDLNWPQASIDRYLRFHGELPQLR